MLFFSLSVQVPLWLVDYRLTPVTAMANMPNPLYSADQKWADPCVMSLRACMREAYENRTLVAQKAAQACHDREALSWENIGKTYVDVLRKF